MYRYSLRLQRQAATNINNSKEEVKVNPFNDICNLSYTTEESNFSNNNILIDNEESFEASQSIIHLNAVEGDKKRFKGADNNNNSIIKPKSNLFKNHIPCSSNINSKKEEPVIINKDNIFNLSEEAIVKLKSRPSIVNKKLEQVNIEKDYNFLTPKAQIDLECYPIGDDVKIIPEKLLPHERPGYTKEKEEEIEQDNDYADENYIYMVKTESEYMPDTNYAPNQDWGWEVRRREVERIQLAHYKLRLRGDVIFAAVNMFDRVCSIKKINEEVLDLLSVTCLFISTKFSKIGFMDPEEYLSFTTGTYTLTQFLSCEAHLCFQIDFKLLYPNPLDLLGLISAGENRDPRLRLMCRYIMEMTLTNHTMLKFKPSLLASCSLYISRIILNYGDWNNELFQLSAYNKVSLKECTLALINNINNISRDSSPDLKYNDIDYSQVASLCRRWVDSRITKLKRTYNDSNLNGDK